MEIKYTPEQTKELFDLYDCIDFSDAEDKHTAREIVIANFMAKHNKSKKSVVAKLSKANKYVIRPKLSKVTGGKPETKEQMLQKIAHKLGMDISKLAGIDKGPKLSLQNLLDRVNEKY